MMEFYKEDEKLYIVYNHAVDRSPGQLVDEELLSYVVERPSQLKRLEIAWCQKYMYRRWAEILMKCQCLEELNLYETKISKEAIETAGRYCPMLKTLKLNQEACSYLEEDTNDSIAIAVGKNLKELRHLELIGNSLTNFGLEAILDGCPHLESLDLRQCWNIDLQGNLGERCLKQIKYLKFPYDSPEGCPYIYKFFINGNIDLKCLGVIDSEGELEGEGSGKNEDISTISLARRLISTTKEDEKLYIIYNHAHAVDRNLRQLVDEELFLYVFERSSQLKGLEIAWCQKYMNRRWAEILMKCQFLEELNLYETKISKEAIETAGRCCPMLKTLKMNQEACSYLEEDTKDFMAIAIGKNLGELRHLELIGNSLTNFGLEAILDGCPHLESLDLRQCWNIDLKGSLGERCLKQIKYIKFPNESPEGCPYIYKFIINGKVELNSLGVFDNEGELEGISTSTVRRPDMILDTMMVMLIMMAILLLILRAWKRCDHVNFMTFLDDVQDRVSATRNNIYNVLLWVTRTRYQNFYQV